MISRLQTNGTGISQRLCCTLKTTTSPLCRTGQSILIKLIAANGPDIIVKDLLNSSCKLWNQIETSHWGKSKRKTSTKTLELEIERMWQMKTEVNPVVVDAVGTVKKWMVETSRKYQKERLWQRPKRSACWDLNESSGGCLVYERMIDLSGWYTKRTPAKAVSEEVIIIL